jgi:hypothetical protein
VAFFDAVAVLAARWQEMSEELYEPARRRLDALVVDRRRAVDDRDLSRTWHEVVDLAVDHLPANSGIRRDLMNALGVPRLAGGRPYSALPLLPTFAPEGRPSIEDWIMSARAYSPDHVQRKGTDPDQPGLIRIRRPDGRVTLPKFQFTRAGDPNPLVLRINRLLGADDDPWGVADWWLCPNAWLAATPAHVIGEVDDELLVAAAVAVTEG